MKSGFRNKYRIEHLRDGEVIWKDTVFNLVVDEGLNDVLEKYFKASNYNSVHYLGLKGQGTILPSNTLKQMADGNAGWAEFTNYTGDRKLIQLGAVANKSVDNSANKAQFSIAGIVNPQGEQVHGVIVATTAPTSDGLGKLFGAVDFTAPRTVLNGDTIIVTVEFTQASV